MLAVVTIDSGMDYGRRVWLRHNEVVRVGRGGRADLPIEGDSRLAEVHFRLRAAHDLCWLENLASELPVWINGRPIQGEEVLEHGDVIIAGQTRFRVTLEDAQGRRGVRAPGESAATAAAAAVRTPTIRYRAERCASGLMRFVGDVQDHSLPDIVQLVAAHHQRPHLVVNFRNARTTPPRGLGTDGDLLRHLSPSPRARHQLMLISPSDGAERMPELEPLLGKNAVCCLFCDRPKKALAQALRPTAISLSAPDILDAQLATCPTSFVRRVLAPVDLILIESHDGSQWHLYPNVDKVPSWREIGFPNPPVADDLNEEPPELASMPRRPALCSA